ncbi:MAG: type I polyketide synthase, partial [Phycisphaerae bacterium]|nr:type I polyketide synthase [Phycisphaerae bacterium]
MSQQEPIAIVGVGGVFPDSPSLDTFWQHIRAGRSVSRPVPAGRWALGPEDAFDPHLAADHVYSRHGCFVDPSELGDPELPVDPDLLARLDPLFSLVLKAGRAAWQDAPSLRGTDRKRVGIILGNIVLPTDASSALADELFGPLFDQKILGRSSAPPRVEPLNRYVAALPAGLLARALDLGGGSFTLDAACASSLYALKLAADELAAGRADAMLAGGVSRPDCLYTQMGFSQLRALSASGRCAPFDAAADGLVVGEGAGVVVLKRLDDARRHGDRIYAVIRGIGLSNDIGGNLMLPDSAGQLRAMRAAYQQASWTPQQIDLIECHGTGTPVGDAVEFQSLRDLWDGHDGDGRTCVIGSVKSNVGHLLTGAGAAGLVKVLLAMQHGQLPPTANFRRPADGIDLADTPFQVLAEARPWARRQDDEPRRAAVSAFGFGGINAHVLLEEAAAPKRTASRTGSPPPAPRPLDIAVVGLDACFGPWDNLEAFAHRVLGAGEEHTATAPANAWGSGIDQGIPVHGIDRVDVPLGRFRIPPAELKQMLPQQLLMLQVAANALADAGLEDAAAHDNLKLGVFVGIGLDLNTTNFHFRWTLLQRARRWARELELELDEAQLLKWVGQLRESAGPPLTADRTMGALGGIVASRVARAFRAGGPSFTVSAEECSGLRALATAVSSLQQGEIDTAICGGVDLACDPRALAAQHDGRSSSRDGRCRPFDRQGQGIVPADGASALVLKRAADARQSGDRIYAVIRGVGAAGGGGVEKLVPTADACHQAMERACGQAGIGPKGIGYIEGHGSGNPVEDECEAEAIARLLGRRSGGPPVAIGSVKADIGHAGAAAAMAALARTCLALHHRVLPALRHTEHLHPVLDPCREELEAPPASRYWLRDRARGPRRALVSGLGVDGNALSAVLEESPTPCPAARPLGPLPRALFAVCAGAPAERSAALEKIQDLAQRFDGAPIDHLARHWWQEHRAYRPAPNRFSIALLAGSTTELRDRARQATTIAADARGPASEGIFSAAAPLGHDGQVAFVFPGSGNHFPGMGRELATHFPGVLEQQDLENDHLAAQFADGRFWREPTSHAPDMRALIFAQVSLGAMVSDCVGQFGIRPQALIGYSLGETAAMFATRSWRDRDEMLRRMHQSTLFTEDLAGPCHAARTVWQLGDDASVDWQAGVVDRPASAVRQALRGRERVYLLIVNTPTACLVGGDRRAVERLVSDMRCAFHPVPGVTTVHCELARPVEKAYRCLHLLPTTPPPGARFYSGAWGRSYTMSRESIADSIVAQAVAPFDYTRVIESAWQDGVRLFLEMGPGASCCRMIDQILGDRPHLALAACAPGGSEMDQLLRLLATLVAEGVPVDLSPLYGDQVAPDRLPDTETPPQISVP